MYSLPYLCLVALAAASPLVDYRHGSDVSRLHSRADQANKQANKANKAFTLHQVANEHYTQEGGLDALIWAYVKHNAELTPTVQDAIRIGKHVDKKFKYLATRQENGQPFGTVQAFPPRDLDIQYVVPVQIGTPPQTVFLNLDTGSGDFWAFSSDTQPWQVRDQRLYDPRASNTSMLIQDARWRITYGDGSGASGIVYTDRVSLGATSFDRQAVESATTVSTSFTRDSFSSGILGLGFGRGNTVRPDRQQTYLENILPTLSAPLFTANLQAGRPGTYNFGFISSREFEGPIGYTPVTRSNPYWEITINEVGVGNSSNRTTALERVIVDTGTTLLLIPTELVEAYYDQVEGAVFDRSWAGWVFPCEAALPDWTYTIGSFKGVVPGRYMSYNQISRTTCFGGIQSSEGIPFAIFGSVLLKAQFAVFDYVDVEGRARPRVGFANKPLL